MLSSGPQKWNAVESATPESQLIGIVVPLGM
jgi:hypothetical protein